MNISMVIPHRRVVNNILTALVSLIITAIVTSHLVDEPMYRLNLGLGASLIILYVVMVIKFILSVMYYRSHLIPKGTPVEVEIGMKINYKVLVVVAMAISWLLILISLVLPNQLWYFGLDRINISTLAFSFVTAYSLPTMISELTRIDLCMRNCGMVSKSSETCLKENIKYKAAGALIISIIPLL